MADQFLPSRCILDGFKLAQKQSRGIAIRGAVLALALY